MAVAQTGSFSEAAGLLHLTQPAVSKRISQLEEEIEESLFDRVGRKIYLTEAGELLLPQCEIILQAVNDALMSLDNLAGKIHGKLTIGTSHHIGLHHLPDYLRRFSQEFPNVDLDIQFKASEEICDKIQRGELELGIITLPDQLPDNLIGQTLWHDKLEFVTSCDHVIAQEHSSPLPLSSLANYDALLPEKETVTREIVEAVFRSQSIALKTKLETNYLETLKMMTSVGLGWSVLPKTMIDEELTIIKIKKVTLERKLGYIQNRKRTLSNAALAMINLLKTHNTKA